MFTDQDIRQFAEKEISRETIQQQIDHFIKGFPFVRLIRPATLNDGIFAFDNQEKQQFIDYFNLKIQCDSVIKFVPASGAASRMFKHLFEFRDAYDGSIKAQQEYAQQDGFNSVRYFIEHLDEIAFYDALCQSPLFKNTDIQSLIESGDFIPLITAILEEPGLNYASLPKGLILFHRYRDGARTSAEEHLMEAAAYARDGKNHSNIHFTISPEHQEKFLELFTQVRNQYETRLDTIFRIDYSQQSPATDTIAVDENNQPVRTSEGTLLFRPGGHGALIQNLQQLDESVIFIKNIDNIVPDRLRHTTIEYKHVIGGYLLFIRDRIFSFLRSAEEGKVPKMVMEDMVQFLRSRLFTPFPGDFLDQDPEVIQSELVKMLNRPIRVCGMVKNEGEPGGGPFWVQGNEGEESLQIVESSQIDMNDPGQVEIVQHATHFNPVDLVCSIRDFKGNKFDLAAFVDQETGFIARKSYGGKTIKAQELPGLWNGAMAKWITVFVEVPIITFNPVKTVNDLLRKQHLES